MGKHSRVLGFGFLILAATLVCASREASAQTYGSVKLNWKVVPIVNLTITPNYQSGFGPQGGVGSGSTPAPGGGASLDGGVIDFGTQVVQGYAYLYKYAVKAAVQTNDSGGFTLYAEGMTDIQDNTNPGSTIPLNQTLYWLPSGTGNTPFSSATAFQKTSASACGVSCINYGGMNPPATSSVWMYPTATFGQPGNAATQGFDYELRLYNSPPADNFSVYIVYTAVGN
jgi:hypothetical protein